MENNSIVKIIDFFKRMVLYHEPNLPDRFILQENDFDDKLVADKDTTPSFTQEFEELRTLLRYAHRVEQQLETVVAELRRGNGIDKGTLSESDLLSKQANEVGPIQLAYYDDLESIKDRPISASLEENSVILGKLYYLPKNTGLVIHCFTVNENPPLKAMLAYMEGLSDKKYITTAVLRPLMALSGQESFTSDDAITQLLRQGIPDGKTKRVDNFKLVQNGINSGSALLFVDGFTEAIEVNTAGGEHRSVDRPVFEQTVRGSQVAFSEVMEVNIGLIRSLCRSSDLISEEFRLGTRSQSATAVMYIESIANPTLVAEVKRRISSLRTDFIADSDMLQQMIDDHPNSPFPTSISTERPDVVAANLAEGRVAIIMEGAPFVHVVPVTFYSLMRSPEDYSMKAPYASFIRLMRWLGISVALLLPASFLAITTFHYEAIPTDLALAISAARDQVPFPTAIEMLLIDIAFELIREAGLRIPGILGPTIGIVGGIILGQAIVAAKIVSPIVIIVVSVTGLASFVIPDYRLATAIRLMRFALTAAAAVFGLVGVALGLLIQLLTLCNMKSFGVPYLAPVSPKESPGMDVVIRGPLYRLERRPDALQTQNVKRQPHISRGWIEDLPEGGDHS